MWGRGWGMGGCRWMSSSGHSLQRQREVVTFSFFFYYQNAKWWRTLWFSMSCTECTSSCMQYFGALTDLSSFVQSPHSSKHNASFFTFSLQKRRKEKKESQLWQITLSRFGAAENHLTMTSAYHKSILQTSSFYFLFQELMRIFGFLICLFCNTTQEYLATKGMS